MSTVLIVILVLLFALSIMGIWAGVSNDAVNFLSSAVGSKAASFKWIILVASVGIFVGATFSSGMMDIPRSGVFFPQYFFLYEVLCIYLATVVTNIILLDIFNKLGFPTSTSVSMVFELLGAAFVVALMKKTAGVSAMEMLNTEKAIVMIVGIFMSVAIAFVFGAVVQWISRFIFTFTYKRSFIKISIFSALSLTAIVYFMLIKGLQGTTIISHDASVWIGQHTFMILQLCFVVCLALSVLLEWLKISALKIVVLAGTFSLALAFSGNDLVNFIGVTVAATSACQDFAANGGTDATTYSMQCLTQPGSTHMLYMIGAGLIMVVTLIVSKKARRVLGTAINLSRQQEGEESFGSSTAARRIVRFSLNISAAFNKMLPQKAKDWMDNRFTIHEGSTIEDGAAFDLLRAAVNLVLGGLLIGLGTSLQLPLSTTYVTFMVGMGSSLSDRAWGRESAVFRITGVISVIGGWIITAIGAFVLCALIALLMYWGGYAVMIILTVFVLVMLARDSFLNRKKKDKEKEDVVLYQLMNEEDKDKVWDLLCQHAATTFSQSIDFATEAYQDIVDAFENENLRTLRSRSVGIIEEKGWLKKMRRKETAGSRRIEGDFIYEKSTYYYLCTNNCQQILNTLLRIEEPIREHVDNNFTPLPEAYAREFEPFRQEIVSVFKAISHIISSHNYTTSDEVSAQGKLLKHNLSELRKTQVQRLQTNQKNLQVDFIYLNLIQESHELLSEIRNVLRGSNKFFNQ